MFFIAEQQRGTLSSGPRGDSSWEPMSRPPPSPASAYCLPTEAMGPRALLALLVATAWYGKCRTGDSGAERGSDREDPSKKSVNICPSLGVHTLCFHFLSVDCRFVGICFGETMKQKECGRGGFPPARATGLSQLRHDSPCVLSNPLVLPGLSRPPIQWQVLGR